MTNAGAQIATWRIASGISQYIESLEVGYGSGANVVTYATLVNGSIRVMQTGSPNFTTARKVTFQGDINSVQMSGLALSEFGWFTSGLLGVGSVWLREGFPSVTFDATNELSVTTTIEVIPG